MFFVLDLTSEDEDQIVIDMVKKNPGLKEILYSYERKLLQICDKTSISNTKKNNFRLKLEKYLLVNTFSDN
jgi:hypothetical protein